MKEKIFILIISLITIGLRIFKFTNTSEIGTGFLSALVITVIYLTIKKNDLSWARVSVVFLAISPWLIVFSRNYASLLGPVSIVFNPREILLNFFSFFSSKYLFFEGVWPNSTKYLSYQGMMYLPDIIFLIFGLKELLLKEKNILEKIILYSFFIFPFFSSVIKIGLFFNFLSGIIMVLVAAKGFSTLIKVRQKILLSLIFIYVLFFIRFIDLYIFHF